MTIRHARWEHLNNYPVLSLSFDDRRTAFVSPEQKAGLLSQGIVCLGNSDGDSWVHELPPVRVLNESGQEVRLEGCFLNDPQIAGLAAGMIAALRNGTFQERDVSVSQEARTPC